MLGALTWSSSVYLTSWHISDQSWACAEAQDTLFAFGQSCLIFFSNAFEKDQAKLFKYSLFYFPGALGEVSSN